MQIDYKAQKLLRLDVEIIDNIIKTIKITGDFFIHPEDKIEDIENLLKDLSVDQVASKLKEFIKKNNVQVIGFTPDDLQIAITQNIIKN